MDYDFGSSETNPKIIIAATIQVEQEEVELQVQAEVDEVISDAKSIAGDTSGVVIWEMMRRDPRGGLFLEAYSGMLTG